MNRDELAGMWILERTRAARHSRRKKSGVRANSQGQRENSDGREGPGLEEHPKRVTQVLEKCDHVYGLKS